MSTHSVRKSRYRTLSILYFVVVGLFVLGLGGGWVYLLKVQPALQGLPPSPRALALYGAGNLMFAGLGISLAIGNLKCRTWGAVGTMVVSLALIGLASYRMLTLEQSSEAPRVVALVGGSFVLLVYAVLFVVALSACLSPKDTEPEHTSLDELVPSKFADPEQVSPPIESQRSNAGIAALVVFLLMLCVAASIAAWGMLVSPADGTQWQQYDYTRVGFRVELPIKPDTRTDSRDGKPVADSLLLYSLAYTHEISIESLPHPEDVNLREKTPEQIRKFEESLINAVFDKADESGLDPSNTEDRVVFGCRARECELLLKGKGVQGRLLVLIGAERTIIVSVLARDEMLTDRVFDSLELTLEPGYARPELDIRQEGYWTAHPDEDCNALLRVPNGMPPYTWDVTCDSEFVELKREGNLLRLERTAAAPEQPRLAYIHYRVWDSEGRSCAGRADFKLSRLRGPAERERDRVFIQQALGDLSSVEHSVTMGEIFSITFEHDAFTELEWEANTRQLGFDVEVREVEGGVKLTGKPEYPGRRAMSFYFRRFSAGKMYTVFLNVVRPKGVYFTVTRMHHAGLSEGYPFLCMPEVAGVEGELKLKLGEGAPDWVRIVETPEGPGIGGIAEYFDGVILFPFTAVDEENRPQESELRLTCRRVEVGPDFQHGVRTLPSAVSGQDYRLMLIGVYWDTVRRIQVVSGSLPSGLNLHQPHHRQTKNEWNCGLIQGRTDAVGEHEFLLEMETVWGETQRLAYRICVNKGGDFLGVKLSESAYFAIENMPAGDPLLAAVDNALSGRTLSRVNWQWLLLSRGIEEASLDSSVEGTEETIERIRGEIRKGVDQPGVRDDIDTAADIDWEHVPNGAHLVLILSGESKKLGGMINLYKWEETRTRVTEKELRVSVIVLYNDAPAPSHDNMNGTAAAKSLGAEYVEIVLE